MQTMTTWADGGTAPVESSDWFGRWTCPGCGHGNTGHERCTRCGTARSGGGQVGSGPHLGSDRSSGSAARGPDSQAGRTVVALIGLTVLAQIVVVAVAIGSNATPVSAVRLSLGVGLVLYPASALWVVVRSRSIGVRPSLGRDTAMVGAAEGFIVGGGLALAMAGLLRLALGHPVLDPTAALLAADGTVWALLLGVLVIVVLAPVVEELVFRGFLAEAFRGKGRWEPIVVSAIAFSLVHLSLAELQYYVFLGVVLGIVYLRRGLIGSICAHAAFNGMLVIVALSATHGPVVEATGGGASVTLPAAWETHAGVAGYDLGAEGPAGSRVELAHVDIPVEDQSAEGLARALVSGSVTLPRELSVHSGEVAVVDLPAGRAVSAGATTRGDDGRVVMVPKGSRLWIFVMSPGGSARDGDDFDAILRSWRLP